MGKSPTEIFVGTINKALKACENISEQDKKAMALAEVAKALAMSGRVSTGQGNNQPEPVTEEEVEQEEVEQETTDEKADPREWTEEMEEKYADELKFIAELKEEYDEEEINKVVRVWSEEEYRSLEDITPLNISAFVDYLKDLTEEEE